MEEDALWLVIGRFADWAALGEFQPAFIEIRDSHTAEACKEADTTLVKASKSHEGACHIALGAVFEELAGTPCEPTGEMPVDAYLAAEGRRELAEVKDYLTAIRDRDRSLYEVVEVQRGLAVIVEDLLRDRESHRVLAPEESKRLTAGDRISARIIRLKRHFYFTPTVMDFEREPADALIEFIDNIVAEVLKGERKLAKKERREPLNQTGLRAEFWPELCAHITNAWLFGQITAEEFDLDEAIGGLRFLTLTFPIATGHRQGVESRLDKHKGFQRASDGSPRWEWAESDDPDSGQSTFQIVGDSIVWETIATDDAMTARNKIRKLLGPTVGPPLVVEQGLGEAFESLARIGHMNARSQGLTEEKWHEEAARNADLVYRTFLNNPNPFLDNQTPREAVRTQDGRVKAAMMLRFMEKIPFTDPQDIAYDMTWIWEELGILALRR